MTGQAFMDCPITTPNGPCERGRRPGHAMCGFHWRLVPRDLQHRIYRAWAYRKRAGRDQRAILEHLQALEDACAGIEGRQPEDLGL